ncbi:MAG: peptidase MA family metallohydrolase [Candidatus Omnitrophica bacterium]|nr:peptidase MA family metallohydrolase [Candidatus Omnitrophota bacterium]
MGEHYASGVINKLEDFYRIITQEFNLVRDKLWLWENRAKVYIAKDRKDYLEEFKCPSWSGACVNYVDKIIYTYPGQENSNSIFAHELTHIIFREYIKNRDLPLWLDEAMATYIEQKYVFSYHKFNKLLLKDIIKENKYIRFNQLMQISNASLYNLPQQDINIFYLESFSIINFLIKKYGKDNFAQFLFYLRSGLNFEQALNKSFLSFRTIEELEEAWKKYYTEN